MFRFRSRATPPIPARSTPLHPPVRQPRSPIRAIPSPRIARTRTGVRPRWPATRPRTPAHSPDHRGTDEASRRSVRPAPANSVAILRALTGLRRGCGQPLRLVHREATTRPPRMPHTKPPDHAQSGRPDSGAGRVRTVEPRPPCAAGCRPVRLRTEQPPPPLAGPGAPVLYLLPVQPARAVRRQAGAPGRGQSEPCGRATAPTGSGTAGRHSALAPTAPAHANTPCPRPEPRTRESSATEDREPSEGGTHTPRARVCRATPRAVQARDRRA